MLNQLSKKNDSTPHKKASDTKANTISIQSELIADCKSTKSSNKTKNSNTERVQNENKNMTYINPKQSIRLHKISDNTSTKENADNSKDNSSTNSRDFNLESKKSIVILGDSILKHLNGWETSKKVKSDCKIFVKHFSGATTNCMED